MSESGMSAVVDRADLVREQFQVEVETLRRDQTLTTDERKARIFDLWAATRQRLHELRDDFFAEAWEAQRQIVRDLQVFPDGALVTDQAAALNWVRSNVWTDKAWGLRIDDAAKSKNKIRLRALISVYVTNHLSGSPSVDAAIRRHCPDDFDMIRQARALGNTVLTKKHALRGTWSCAKPLEITAFRPPSKDGATRGRA